MKTKQNKNDEHKKVNTFFRTTNSILSNSNLIFSNKLHLNCSLKI